MTIRTNRRRFNQVALLNLLAAKTKGVIAAAPLSTWLPEAEESGYIPTPQGRLWYRINGKQHFASGKTPLICLHGGPGASHHYLLPLVMDILKD